MCVRARVCARARVCVWGGGGDHPQTLTEDKHRPPRIVLGIFRINFTTALELIFDCGQVLDLVCYMVNVCQRFVPLSPSSSRDLDYLLWDVLYLSEKVIHTPQPHPEKVKKKRKYSTIQNKRKS